MAFSILSNTEQIDDAVFGKLKLYPLLGLIIFVKKVI